MNLEINVIFLIKHFFLHDHDNHDEIFSTSHDKKLNILRMKRASR